MARPCHRQCGVYIRRPQIRNKQSASAEDIQRQKTVVVVIAVKEPSVLIAVHEVIGGVKI